MTIKWKTRKEPCGTTIKRLLNRRTEENTFWKENLHWRKDWSAIMTFQRFVNCIFGSIAFLACIGTFIVFLVCGDKTQDYTLSRILRITIPLVLLIAVMIIAITKCLWNSRRSTVELRTEEQPNIGNNNGGYHREECECIFQFGHPSCPKNLLAFIARTRWHNVYCWYGRHRILYFVSCWVLTLLKKPFANYT